MKTLQLYRITCEVIAELAPVVKAAIAECGIPGCHSQTARTVVLRESNLLLGLFPRTAQEEIPTEVIRFTCPAEFEETVIACIAHAASLHIPGRGNIYSKPVTTHVAEAPLYEYARLSSLQRPKINMLTDLTGIHCIVQRDSANAIARAILDMGLSVPTIVFGTGGGFRERLGLLRIAVPGAKETISLVLNRHDAEDAMDKLAEAARLDQPGKGLLYAHHLSRGVINTRFFIGKMKHIASIEQIIYAIDDIKGGNQWRTRAEQRKRRRHTHNAVMHDVTIYCNEDTVGGILAAAMTAGAGGATIYDMQFTSFTGRHDIFSPARQMSNLIIRGELLEPVTRAILDAGLLDPSVAGMLEISSVPMAFSYSGAR